ncbi:MAG TPA: hypothetical protein PKE69_20265, partial [Pyrinomonadaceae bacterium]|nr:hypothetical protein [Pyrinomonadaceae bacterium]
KYGYRFIAPVSLVDDDIEVIEHTQTRVLIREVSEEVGETERRSDEVIFPQPLNPSVPSVHRLASAVPETQYVENDDVNIAYQIVGDGDLDIVFVMGWVSHLEYF